MMQLLNIIHMQKHNLPSWRLFNRSVAVFNEEVGEHSFSVLSRVVLGDNNKCSFKHMHYMYQMIHTYRQCAGELLKDQGRKKRTTTNMDIHRLHSTQTAVTNFMLDTIRSIKAHTYRVYPGAKNKANPSYPNVNSSSASKIVRTATRSMWEIANVMPLRIQLKTMMNQARATYCGSWAHENCSADWPEMRVISPATIAAISARSNPFKKSVIKRPVFKPSTDDPDFENGSEMSDVVADHDDVISSEGEPSDADEAQKASSDEDVVKQPVVVVAKRRFAKV